MDNLEQIKLVSGLSYTVVKLLVQYNKVAILLGTFFFEESFIIAAVFLSAQGFFPLYNVFFFSIIGIFLCDSFWFFFGERFLKIVHQRFLYERMENSINWLFQKRPFLVWFFFKFLYGIKFLVIVYFSINKVSYKKFIFYDILGTVMLLFVLIPIGWLAGKGIYNFIPVYKSFNQAVIILFAVIFVYNLFAWLLGKKITKKIEKI